LEYLESADSMGEVILQRSTVVSKFELQGHFKSTRTIYLPVDKTEGNLKLICNEQARDCYIIPIHKPRQTKEKTHEENQTERK